VLALHDYNHFTPQWGFVLMGTFIASVFGLCAVVGTVYPDKLSAPKTYPDGLEAELGGKGALVVSVVNAFAEIVLMTFTGTKARRGLVDFMHQQVICKYSGNGISLSMDWSSRTTSFTLLTFYFPLRPHSLLLLGFLLCQHIVLLHTRRAALIHTLL
jgi:hypothetical protein